MKHLRQTFTVYRIIPNQRPLNAQGDILVSGEILLKGGFESKEAAEQWMDGLPPDKFRAENLYEIRPTLSLIK